MPSLAPIKPVTTFQILQRPIFIDPNPQNQQNQQNQQSQQSQQNQQNQQSQQSQQSQQYHHQQNHCQIPPASQNHYDPFFSQFNVYNK